MANKRALVMLFLSLLLGLGAALIAASWVQGKAVPDAPSVVVAATDIELGSRLNPQLLKSVPWPRGDIPPGAFSDPKTLNDRVLRSSVLKGEPILGGKLSPAGTTGGLSAVIAEGKRAITVRVNDVVGVAGFALPGNHVDVVVNTQGERPAGSERDHSISKIVLEHILVLAVAQEVGRDETKPRVVNAVTLEVTPEQAEKIDLARSIGNLSLVLRNQGDLTPSGTLGATRDSLLGESRRPEKLQRPQHLAPRPREPLAHCIEVLSGTRLTLECF